MVILTLREDEHVRNRQILCADWTIFNSWIGTNRRGANLLIEHIETPTGRMRIVSDDAHNLRALDWDDHEPRMQDLLRRYYGDAVHLREVLRPSLAARSLLAYFDGDLDAIADLATATGGHGLPAHGLVRAPPHSSRTHRQLRHARSADRTAQSRARGRVGERRQSNFHCRSLPSGDRGGFIIDRLRRRAASQTMAVGARARRAPTFRRASTGDCKMKSETLGASSWRRGKC